MVSPRVVGESARLLTDHADSYLFVSTISAIRDWPAEPVDENSPLHECPPDAGPDDGDYGVLKAGCERAVAEEFDGRVLIISPGLILGPHENVGRLPWWLRRIARGGHVLAPGDPDRRLQVIDARDIARFGLTQIVVGSTGRFLASGVRGNTTFGRLLSDCVFVTGSDAELVWVDDEFLLDHGVEEWTELPMWTAGGPETAAIWLPSSEKALAAGLRCRPVTETVRDTWEWVASGGGDRLRVYRETVEHGIDLPRRRRSWRRGLLGRYPLARGGTGSRRRTRATGNRSRRPPGRPCRPVVGRQQPPAAAGGSSPAHAGR